MKKIILVPVMAVLLSVNSLSYAQESAIEETVQEQPAVEKVSKKKRKAKEENVVPVLELQGGVDETRSAPEEIEEAASPLKSWLEGDYATGDWGGARSRLEDRGVTFEAIYMTDIFQKLHGGSQVSKYPAKAFGALDTAIILETEKMGLWKGGTATVRFQHAHGWGLNERYIGAYQYVNAFDVGPFTHLAEFWYQQAFFDDLIEIKVGKQDACYDFMTLDLATNFVNNSHAWFMPNVPLPAYPDQALGLVLKVNPTEWLSLRSGWYDGNARGGVSPFSTAFGGDKASFLIQEIGVRHKRGNMPGTILAGGWLHTGHVEEFDTGEPRAQTYGWYFEAEQMLWKEKKDYPEDTQGLYILGQVSMAPENRIEASKYYGAALMYKGLFKNRDEDVLGIGTAIAQFSRKLKGIDGRSGGENIIEAFYKIQVTPWMSLQPTAQFIHRVNGYNTNAFTLGLRTTITF